MDKFSSVVIEHGEVKVTLSGHYPTKGNLQEVFEVDIVGLPVMKVSLNKLDVPVVTNRHTLRASLNAVFNEIWDVTSKDIQWKLKPFQHYVRNNSVNVNRLMNEYTDGLKHDYMLNPAFSFSKGLVLTLSDKSHGQAIVRFKLLRPGYYEVFFTHSAIIHNGGSSRKTTFSYHRDYPVENTQYLRNQIKEWLTCTKPEHNVDPKTHGKLINVTLYNFDKLEPLISNALVNLNEGNNL